MKKIILLSMVSIILLGFTGGIDSSEIPTSLIGTWYFIGEDDGAVLIIIKLEIDETSMTTSMLYNIIENPLDGDISTYTISGNEITSTLQSVIYKGVIQSLADAVAAGLDQDYADILTANSPSKATYSFIENGFTYTYLGQTSTYTSIEPTIPSP